LSIGIAANCPLLYEYGFSKYDISRATGISGVELKKVSNGLISYFNSDEEYIDLTVEKNGRTFILFNEREAEHLKDVKALFHLDYRLLIITLVYGVVYIALNYVLWKDKRRIWWGLALGGGLTLALLASAGLIIAIDFSWFFYQFHIISFANDLWLLDPTTDYLIMLFPEGFWFDATMACAILTAVLAIIAGSLGWRQLKRTGTEKG
jgi:integral membrane protein (TIGR01906 family)